LHEVLKNEKVKLKLWNPRLSMVHRSASVLDPSRFYPLSYLHRWLASSTASDGVQIKNLTPCRRRRCHPERRCTSCRHVRERRTGGHSFATLLWQRSSWKIFSLDRRFWSGGIELVREVFVKKRGVATCRSAKIYNSSVSQINLCIKHISQNLVKFKNLRKNIFFSFFSFFPFFWKTRYHHSKIKFFEKHTFWIMHKNFEN